MGIVLLKVTIKNKENTVSFETKGILKEKSNILIYDDAEKTRNVLDLSNNTLKRENNEMQLLLRFVKGKVTFAEYILGGSSMKLEMKIKTLRFSKSNNKYNVVYEINDTDRIEYIVEMLN